MTSTKLIPYGTSGTLELDSYGPPSKLSDRQWRWLCVNHAWHKVESYEQSMEHWLRENGFLPPLEGSTP